MLEEKHRGYYGKYENGEWCSVLKHMTVFLDLLLSMWFCLRKNCIIHRLYLLYIWFQIDEH